MRICYYGTLLIVIGYLIFPSQALAHNEHVHQYLAIQAFELLRKQFPGMESSVMASHVGTQDGPEATCPSLFTTGVGRPWETGLITSGAFKEDCEDVVYERTGILDRMNTHFGMLT